MNKRGAGKYVLLFGVLLGAIFILVTANMIASNRILDRIVGVSEGLAGLGVQINDLDRELSDINLAPTTKAEVVQLALTNEEASCNVALWFQNQGSDLTNIHCHMCNTDGFGNGLQGCAVCHDDNVDPGQPGHNVCVCGGGVPFNCDSYDQDGGGTVTPIEIMNAGLTPFCPTEQFNFVPSNGGFPSYKYCEKLGKDFLCSSFQCEGLGPNDAITICQCEEMIL